MPDSLASARILPGGRRLIQSAAAGFSRFAPHSFAVGSQPLAAEALTDAIVDAVGTKVFTGRAESITGKVTSPTTVRYSLTMDEGDGSFSFGNVVMFASNYDGVAVPFAVIGLPYQILKEAGNVGVTPEGNPFPIPGSRVVVSLIISYQVVDEPSISVTVTAPTYASLPQYPTDADVPAAIANPWPQFIVHSHQSSGTPAFVAKRADGTYWAVGMLQDLNDPMFGGIDGGVTGDGYQPPPNIAFGGWYFLDQGTYQESLGPQTYLDFTLNGSSDVIGGTPY